MAVLDPQGSAAIRHNIVAPPRQNVLK